MKLTGSTIEQEFKDELLKSNTGITSKDSRLRAILELHGNNSGGAFTLHWTPEQCEDIYLILIEGEYLIQIEIDKSKKQNYVLNRIELKSYLKGLKKVNQIRLAIAQELAEMLK